MKDSLKGYLQTVGFIYLGKGPGKACTGDVYLLLSLRIV